MKKLLFISALLLTAVFSFVPNAYADDPCATISQPPLLYQINRTPTSATLFFTPIANDQASSYTIIYGLKPEDERYSLTVNQGVSTGAISYTINNLTPGVQYSYKVQGSTPCTSSPWSSWQNDKPVTKGSSVATPGIPVTGPFNFIPAVTISIVALLSGLGLFFYTKKTRQTI